VADATGIFYRRETDRPAIGMGKKNVIIRIAVAP